MFCSQPACRYGYRVVNDDIGLSAAGSGSSDGGPVASSGGAGGAPLPLMGSGAESGSTGGTGVGGGPSSTGGSSSGGAAPESGGAGSGGSSSTPHNLAFVSSSPVPTTLGSLAAYDQRCNDLATAASLPAANGSNFVAWMSSDTVDARDRVIGYRGWTRVDGTPFADELTGTNREVFNSIDLDENRVPVSDGAYLLTGTRSDGTSDQTCSNWTDASDTLRTNLGLIQGGPKNISYGALGSCDFSNLHLLCLMLESGDELIPPPSSGKVVYTTNAGHIPGSIDPDAACEVDKPAGTGAVKALVARTTSAAGDRLSAAQMYVRPDGIEVGLGSEIIAENARSGIWQTGDGSYTLDHVAAWTGQDNLTSAGTPDGTCNDWSDTLSPGGYYGDQQRSRNYFHSRTRACDLGRRFFCAEQ